MKFEIRNPAEVDEGAQPWEGAIRETLTTTRMKFVPLAEGLDGTPHQNESGATVLAMIGGYQPVDCPIEVWTIEIATLEELMLEFLCFDISISHSQARECAGLIEFEERPSVSSIGYS